MGQATGSDGGEIQHDDDLMEMGQATGSGGDGTGNRIWWR